MRHHKFRLLQIDQTDSLGDLTVGSYVFPIDWLTATHLFIN